MEPHGEGKGGGGPDTGLEGTYGTGGTRRVRAIGVCRLSLEGSDCSLGFWISTLRRFLTGALCVGSAESLQRLGLGGDEAAGKLPERPGEADCAYYLRTGACAYGERCRYNHPRDRRAAAVNGVGRTTSTVEYPERPGQPLCEYYVKNGTCKFGSNCKYDHPREGGFVPVALNRSGYPLRLGENECSYYIKTGYCKFGATCKFHHPELGVAEASNIYPPVQQSTISSTHPYPHLASLQMGRPPFVPGSFLPGSYPPMMLPSTVMPMQGWNPYIAPMNQTTPAGGQQTVQAGPPYGLSHQGPTSSVTYGSQYAPLYPSTGPSSSNKQGHGFPERPGQPECEHYMKTGTCKFGPTCKSPSSILHCTEFQLHAELSRSSTSADYLNLQGSQPCAYYAQHGFCKFGPACKFDHPMGSLSYSSAVSSLTDVPVAPYPFGFPVGPMARSSSDLRPQYNTLNKESSANQLLGTTYGHAGSVSKVYAPHTLIRSPASTAAGMQAS
ncbi:hypothetical protein PR202_ga23897 [Eleusine coracana subsp. coracana]|uniref:C3H1-type domain-containing protein n=1 Tax=Eleusine coracana subsp. coracana TaxID=191504 RepID=A0AAV5D5F0_ELECO|nr:hypothetical protein PR202_ga23897 [Eleusine coracana subsp. coracana]